MIYLINRVLRASLSPTIIEFYWCFGWYPQFKRIIRAFDLGAISEKNIDPRFI